MKLLLLYIFFLNYALKINNFVMMYNIDFFFTNYLVTILKIVWDRLKKQIYVFLQKDLEINVWMTIFLKVICLYFIVEFCIRL